MGDSTALHIRKGPARFTLRTWSHCFRLVNARMGSSMIACIVSQNMHAQRSELLTKRKAHVRISSFHSAVTTRPTGSRRKSFHESEHLDSGQRNPSAYECSNIANGPQ